MKNNFSLRDKAVIIGLYLSKFDQEAVSALGFITTKEAFNTLGYSIGYKANSIKNYRDEFDPYFPNSRKGRHKREIRGYCKIVLDHFGELSFVDFTELVKSISIKNYDIEKILIEAEKRDFSESVSKRLITGAAAEEYFKIKHSSIIEFENYQINDTTKMACGFDFKLTLNLNFFCVEVKGLNSNEGNISMTEKEFIVAQSLKEKYCLFIVSNFIEYPVHQYLFDPLNSRLKFKKIKQNVTQTTYSSQI